MIRYYPGSRATSLNYQSPDTSTFHLTTAGVVYRLKEGSGWGSSATYGAFYSPTLQRWIKGKLTGSSPRVFLATMDTPDEATLIGEGVSGMKTDSEEFNMKMFLLAGEVVEKEPEPAPPPIGAVAGALYPGASIPISQVHYLDEVSDYYGCDAADWTEVKRTANGRYVGVHLLNPTTKVEVVAQLENGGLYNHYAVGPLSFGINDYDGSLVVTLGITSNGQLDVPDYEMGWLIDTHYGLDFGDVMCEGCENYWEVEDGLDIATARAKLEAMGLTYDPSIDDDQAH